MADGIDQTQNPRVVGVQKPTDNGIVIPALEIIESGIGIVEIAAVAEGVDVRDMGGVSGNVDTGPVEDGEDVTPGVVDILCDEMAVRVEDAVDRPDGVAEVQVVGAVQREALEFLIAAVIEIQHVAAGLDAAEAVSVPVIRGFHPAHGLGPPQALVVIGIRRGRAVFRQLGQVPALLPQERKAVAVLNRVADRAVGDGLPVPARELILPCGIAVSVIRL